MTVRSDRWHRNVAIAQALAYVLLVTVIAFVFYVDGQQTEARCAKGEENRQALRNLVVAIGELGEDLVIGGTGDEEPTPEQQATLDQFAKFQAAQLKALSGDVCDTSTESDSGPDKALGVYEYHP